MMKIVNLTIYIYSSLIDQRIKISLKNIFPRDPFYYWLQNDKNSYISN